MTPSDSERDNPERDNPEHIGDLGEDPPLTPAQMQMMAYIDDELSQPERQAFETQMSRDEELSAEVVHHQNLLAMTRSVALLEPTDHECRRFWARFYNRGEWRLGWCLLLAGATALAGWGLWALLTCDLNPIPKLAVIAMLAGAGILIWNTARLKMRTSRFDRYRGVMR